MLKLLLLICFSGIALSAPKRLARLEKARDRVPGRYIVKVKVYNYVFRLYMELLRRKLLKDNNYKLSNLVFRDQTLTYSCTMQVNSSQVN